MRRVRKSRISKSDIARICIFGADPKNRALVGDSVRDSRDARPVLNSVTFIRKLDPLIIKETLSFKEA